MNLVVSEHFIREIFSHFGEVIEVSLKKVCFDAEMSVQNGYGFVHFSISLEGILSALRAVECLHQVTINSISYDCSVSNQLRQVLINIYKGKSNLFSFNHLINAVNNPNNLLAIIGGGFNGQNPNKSNSKNPNFTPNNSKTPRSNNNTPRVASNGTRSGYTSGNSTARTSPPATTTSSTSSYRNYDTLLQFQQQNQFSNTNLPLSGRSNYQNSYPFDFSSDSNSNPLSARSDSSNQMFNTYNNNANVNYYGKTETNPSNFYPNFFMYQNNATPNSSLYPNDLINNASNSGHHSYNNSPRTFYENNSSYSSLPIPPTQVNSLNILPNYDHSPRDDVEHLSNVLEKTSISNNNVPLPPPGLSQKPSQHVLNQDKESEEVRNDDSSQKIEQKNEQDQN